MAGPDEANGAQRAAAFLLSLEKEAAVEVIKHLDENVIVEVVEAMGTLDHHMTDPKNIEQLQKELVKALHQPSGARLRSEEELFRMLEQTLGKEMAGSVFDKIQQRLLQERPFISIEKESAFNIGRALIDESDAVSALVLAHIDPALSADVLNSFPPERALEIVKRMANLIPPGFETLLEIAQQLSDKLGVIASLPVDAEPSLRLKTIAEVLNYSEPEVEKNVLEGIDAENADMATEIRDFMFTWEDLADVDKRAMQKILASVDTRTLSVSLKACSASVEQNIMNNLSSRVKEMVIDERELAGAMPMTEVLQNRGEIMKAVRGLMESGEFRPARAGEDLVT
jgi:flagellar motor switch protein FliG